MSVSRNVWYTIELGWRLSTVIVIAVIVIAFAMSEENRGKRK